MKRIYISIPITGYNVTTQRQKADLVKAKLSREGWTPVSPFDIYAGKNPKYEDYICADLRAMMDCDAIFMCKGWESSVGCRIEYSVATLMKIRTGKPQEVIFEN